MLGILTEMQLEVYRDRVEQSRFDVLGIAPFFFVLCDVNMSSYLELHDVLELLVRIRCKYYVSAVP